MSGRRRDSAASWTVVVLVLLGAVAETQLTSYDGGHAFVPGNHDRYIMRDISSMHEELTSEVGSAFNSNTKVNLRFEPEFLDFQRRPLGVPHVEKVRLINTDCNRSVDMTSISGSTVHFHSSFFENKRIPPLGNTTFNVVFLGREEGFIESSLFIHTTEGHLKYRVKGASIYSPYRLRPIVGVKLPINTSFSPLIYMHNPHTEPIQIVEVYSSGGDFHLELPSGELEGPKDLWEIPPLETKAIIRVRFHARAEQNHTAYVRIKLNNTDEVLVVPLEVEVTPSAILFHPQGAVDFGVGGSLDSPKKTKLVLRNPTRKPVKIQSVSASSRSVRVDFDAAAAARSRSDESVEVATLTVDWRSAFDAGDFSGKIVIRYGNGRPKTEIPYYVTCVEGGVWFNASATKYFVREKSDSELPVRRVEVRNDFPQPVMVMDAVLPTDAQNYFQISDFKSTILRPKEERPVLTLVLKGNVSLVDSNLNSHIVLKTNVSDVEIPLLTYNGQLEKYLSFKSKDNSLDLGLISAKTSKHAHIVLLNKNPVSVGIKNLTSFLPTGTVEVIGCDHGDPVEALSREDFKNAHKCVRLRPGDYAIIRLVVHTSSEKGPVWNHVLVQTQYEKMLIPFHFKVAQGRLDIDPEVIVFDQCFPGKVCAHPLKVHSTFNDPMVIEDILTIPPDVCVSTKHNGHIAAKSTKVIGQLFIDLGVECHNECYLGIPKEHISDWSRTFSLPKSTSEQDINLVNTFYNRYLNVTSNRRWQVRDVTLRMDTSEVRGYVFRAQARLSWPSLVAEVAEGPGWTCRFPLTQVGNISYQNVTLVNPSSHNLFVQILIDHVYPNSEGLKDALSYDFFQGASPMGPRRAKPSFFFAENYSVLRDIFVRNTNLVVNKNSLPLVLKPGENFTVRIGYLAIDSNADSSFLLVRNNLTVLEIVHLKAQGAYPSFKFGNRKPGAIQPLFFELTEKHLKDCERDKSHKKFISTNLSIKRTFTARNTGDVVIHINNFLINSLSCEGYGFKILNCEPFSLKPNTTRKIDIEFTPDFTLSKITRTLTLETSLNQNVNYTLVATVPQMYLSLCQKIIPRPIWESFVYNCSIFAMFSSLICVCIVALIESERILKLALNVISRHSPSTQPTLDLRLIGAQTRAEIRNPKSEIGEQKDKDSGDKKSVTEEQKPVSQEKYTVLIPTMGKAKKRLAKSKSNDVLHETADANKNKEKGDVKEKIAEKIARKHEMKMNKIESHKKNLKEKRFNINNNNNNVNSSSNPNNNNNNNKKEAKLLEPLIPVVVEEETSSTTTESSCTNEEVEKPIKILKISRNENLTKPLEKVESTVSSPVNHQKPDFRRKSVPRSNHAHPNSKKEFKENIQENRNDTKPTHHRSRHSKDSIRKEKIFTKKSTASDKTHPSVSLFGNASRTSPSVSSVWSESKATFSDVVSRVEVSTPPMTTTSSPVTTNVKTTEPVVVVASKPQPAPKPTVYVEPYNIKGNGTVELGPIGSRKDYWQEASSGIFQGHAEAQFNGNNNNNSFFSDQATGGAATPGFDVGFDVGYNPLDLQYCAPQDPWLSDIRTAPSTSDYWNLGNSHIDVGIETPVAAAAPFQDTCWTWGSPVWQPLGTDLARVPTRTPPGFARQRDDERMCQPQPTQQLRQPQPPEPTTSEGVYGPFSVNIWSHQQTNPWNFPHNQ